MIKVVITEKKGRRRVADLPLTLRFKHPNGYGQILRQTNKQGEAYFDEVSECKGEIFIQGRLQYSGDMQENPTIIINLNNN